MNNGMDKREKLTNYFKELFAVAERAAKSEFDDDGFSAALDVVGDKYGYTQGEVTIDIAVMTDIACILGFPFGEDAQSEATKSIVNTLMNQNREHLGGAK